MPGIVAILLLLSLLMGAVMLWVGVRGRRLNDHPVCRQCAFDLEGVYPESVTCPECGAGLKRDHAVRIGVRQRMAGLILLGVVLAAIPVVPIGAVAWAGLTGSNIDSYKPLGLLLWEANHSDTTRLDAIASELDNRLLARKLDPAQYQRLIEATLALQGDTSKPWTEAWGDLIERAKLDGVLKPDQEQRFSAQAAVLELETRRTIQAGTATPVRIKLREARVGSSTSLTYSVRATSVALGGREVSLEVSTSNAGAFFGEPFSTDGAIAAFSLNGSKAAGGGMVFFGSGIGGDSTATWSVKVPPDAAPGATTLKLNVLSSADDGAASMGRFALLIGRSARSPQTTTKTDAEASMVLTAPVRIVGPDQPVAAASPADAATTGALTKALRPESLSMGSSLLQSLLLTPDGTSRSMAGDSEASARFDVDSLPVPIAFDVYCRAGGREWKLGELHSSKQEGQGSASLRGIFSSMTTITINGRTVTSSSSNDGSGRAVTGPWQGGDADRVDLILRPSAEVAGRTIDLENYYGGEIVIENVPVDRRSSSELAPFGDIDRLFQQQLNGVRRRSGTPSSLSPAGRSPGSRDSSVEDPAKTPTDGPL